MLDCVCVAGESTLCHSTVETTCPDSKEWPLADGSSFNGSLPLPEFGQHSTISTLSHSTLHLSIWTQWTTLTDYYIVDCGYYIVNCGYSTVDSWHSWPWPTAPSVIKTEYLWNASQKCKSQGSTVDKTVQVNHFYLLPNNPQNSYPINSNSNFYPLSHFFLFFISLVFFISFLMKEIYLIAMYYKSVTIFPTS